jgi:hypothetical protein
MRIGQSHRNARVPQETAPVRGGRSWGHLRGNGAGAARDVQLPADHIRFAAADQFCTLSSFLWRRSCGLRG